jgi:hypothetical protein
VIDQLWYGWTLRGVGGVVGEQVIATSDGLAHTSDPRVRQIVDWISAELGIVFAWRERGDIGMAFRRTAVGEDAFGRSGATFVHALVWAAGTVEAGSLASLADASAWQRSAPESLPDRLEILEDLSAFSLANPPPISQRVLVHALAHSLSAIAADELTILPPSSEPAARIAAHIAHAMPSRYGLMSYVEGRTDAPFNMAKGQVDLETAISPPDPRWVEAAELLLLACTEREDPVAAGAVSALVERMSSRWRFANALGAWVEVERACRSADEIPVASGAQLISSDDRLLRRLLCSGAAPGVARLVIHSGSGDGILRSARRLGADAELGRELVVELRRQPPATALERLAQLSTGGLTAEANLLLEVASDWSDKQLDGLPTDSAVGLADALGHTSAGPTGLILTRLCGVQLRATALMRSRISPEWKAYVARLHPNAVTPLLAVAAQDRRFVESFLEEDDGRLTDVLIHAVDDAPMPGALVAAGHVADTIDREQRWRVLWPTIRRIRSDRDRLAAMNRWAPSDGAPPPGWLELAIESYIQVVLAERDQPKPLPTLSDPALKVRPSTWSSGIAAWADLARALQWPVDAQALAIAVIAAQRMGSNTEFDVALETLVERITTASPSFAQWCSAVDTVRRIETDATFVPRIAAAANRANSPASFRVIGWIADHLDRKDLNTRVLGASVIENLPRRLHSSELRWVEQMASDQSRRRTTRRWLSGLVSSADRGIA